MLYGEMLRHHLALNPDNEVYLYRNGEECLKNMYREPNMVSLDYSLPDMSGLDIMRRIKKKIFRIFRLLLSRDRRIFLRL